ncbi:hypothetical protein [Bacterioplanoides pacificum]|uniref:hypothetical protein n=1 Tax=Bacterioplanoides pacificum TaxID=1171596 RepID=UPI00366B53EE
MAFAAPFGQQVAEALIHAFGSDWIGQYIVRHDGGEMFDGTGWLMTVVLPQLWITCRYDTAVVIKASGTTADCYP